MSSYNRIPSTARAQVTPFKAHVSDEKLKHMLDLLKLSPIGPAVWENTSKNQGETLMSDPSRRFGMRRDWLEHAKDVWLNRFDWRKQEERINSFPQFILPIKGDDGIEIEVHFMALFSERKDAIPIAFFHGWPGSFLEFLGLFTLLREKYSPQELPYHVLAPSFPGYAYSSGPPVDADYSVPQGADIMHKLMLALGFDSYLCQGGDIGAGVCTYLAARYPECVAMHVNMLFVGPPADAASKQIDEAEAKALQRGKAFQDDGSAYIRMHGTRTATIGLVLSASPLAMLAWIGEKFLEWSDEDPPVEEILASVSLYWLTDTYARCIYPYRAFSRGDLPRAPYISKPCGFSWFPKELVPTPKSWAEDHLRLVSFHRHDKGGHFAALEQPKALLEDVEEWVGKAWKPSKL